MRKSLALVLAIAVMTMAFAGCGNSGDSVVTETTIELKKDGSVIHTIVESFTEDYYDLQELTDMIQAACDSYNASAGADAVAVSDMSENEGILTVKMTYRDASAYAGFNKLALFSGTIKDAYNAGYDLNVTLYSLQDDSVSVGKEEILGMGEKHIAIVREAVDVKVWDKVLYASGDVLGTGDGRTVMVGDNSALTYIIFE